MIENERTKLSPEEVAAFVAQWAEQHPTDLQKLSDILGVDESTSESLMRQAQGRISRNKWVAGQGASSKTSSMTWLYLSGALLVGAGLGAFLVSTFLSPKPATEATSSSVSPKVEITTENTPIGNPTIPKLGHSSAGAAVPGGRTGWGPNISSNHHVGQLGGPPRVTNVKPKNAPGVKADSTTMTSLSGTSVLHLPKTLGNQNQDSEGPLMVVDPTDLNLPLEDATAKLSSKLPNDLKVEMFTPVKRFVFKGAETRNVQATINLNQNDLAKPIQNSLAYVVERGMLPSEVTARPQRSPSLRIRISVGSAEAFATLPWIPAQKAMLLSLAKSNNSLFFMMLVGPLMSRIRISGNHLFSDQHARTQTR